MARRRARAIAPLLLALSVVAAPAQALPPQQEGPGAVHRAGRAAWDLVILRPLGLVQTVAGVALFPIFYPVSLATGGSEHVVHYFVASPVEQTFRRPLGE